MDKQINNLNSWVTAPLGDICQILDSQRIPVNSEGRSERILGKPASELYPYYGATGWVGVIDGYLFEGEHILLGEDGAPFLEPFRDKAYIVDGEFWVNNHAHILRSKISNQYLCYYLNQLDYSDYVTGTTRLKLTQSALKAIPIEIAPANEQKRIVAKIEELFSELDNGVKSLETAREQLKIYRQAVLKHAFEGKLTAAWREKNQSEIIAIDQFIRLIQRDREDCYKQQMKEWIDNNKLGKKTLKPRSPKSLIPISSKDLAYLSNLPQGWSYIRLGEIIEEPKYGTSKKCDYDVEGHGVLRIPNIASGVVDSSDLKFAQFDEYEIETYDLRRGDILTIRSNGSISIVGKCALITEKDEKLLYAGYLIRLRLNNHVISPEFLLLVLTNPMCKFFRYATKRSN